MPYATGTDHQRPLEPEFDPGPERNGEERAHGSRGRHQGNLHGAGMEDTNGDQRKGVERQPRPESADGEGPPKPPEVAPEPGAGSPFHGRRSNTREARGHKQRRRRVHNQRLYIGGRYGRRGPSTSRRSPRGPRCREHPPPRATRSTTGVTPTLATAQRCDRVRRQVRACENLIAKRAPRRVESDAAIAALPVEGRRPSA
jgi:hypothetical protein